MKNLPKLNLTVDDDQGENTQDIIQDQESG